MATVTAEIRYAPKSTAWFTANAALVLSAGEPAYHETTGLFKLGDGVTALSALSFLPSISSGLTIGTTTITSGTDTRILYNNAGVVGEYTVTGTGNTAVLSTSPTFTTDITTPKIISTNIQLYNSATSYFNFKEISASFAGIYANVVTPGITNYIIGGDGTYGVLNSPVATAIKAAGTNMVFYSINPTADGLTAFHEEFGITATAQTATIARAGFLKAGNTVQWNTGTIALQYENRLTGGTYSFVGASTITTSATLEVSAATASTNCTITNNYSGRFTGGHGLQIAAGTIAGQGIVIREGVSLAAEGAIYIGVTPSSTNYCFRAVSNYTHVNYGTIGSLTLSASGNARLTLDNTTITYSSGFSEVYNTTTGTTHGTAANQKQGFWGATAIVQPTTSVTAGTLVSNAGTALTSTDTIDGYTLLQVVKALRNTGLLA